MSQEPMRLVKIFSNEAEAMVYLSSGVEQLQKNYDALARELGAEREKVKALLGLFSDYDSPCTSVEMAGAIWNFAMKRYQDLNADVIKLTAENAKLAAEIMGLR